MSRLGARPGLRSPETEKAQRHRHKREAYRAEWAAARMDQLNDEAVLVAHRISQLIQAKYRALHRLYNGLAVLVVLCTLLLVAYAVWGSMP